MDRLWGWSGFVYNSKESNLASDRVKVRDDDEEDWDSGEAPELSVQKLRILTVLVSPHG